MRRRRWPDGAEQQRKDAIAMIRDARTLLQKARKNTILDPRLAELMLADADTQLADAERFLLLAKLGESETL